MTFMDKNELVFGRISQLRFGFSRRLPVVMQTEAAECGLACMVMILGFHGHTTDLLTLRQRFSLSLKGATMKAIIDMASELHFSARPLRLELDELGELSAPCILHWRMTHYVVLRKVLRNRFGVIRGVVIHDPAKGEVSVSMVELSEHFTGVALELLPNQRFRIKREKKQLNLRSLLRGVVGLRRGLAQIFVLAIVLEIISLVSPLFMQWVVDGAIQTRDVGLLDVLVIGFGLLMLVQTAIGLARSWSVMYMSTHLGLQWIANVFHHLIRLPITFFEKRHLGDVISRFGSISSIQKTLTTNFIEAIIDGMLAIATLAMMLIYSVKLSLVVFVSILVYGLLRAVAYTPFRRAAEEQMVLQARAQTLFMESIRGVQSIKLFNRENDRMTRWLNAVVDALNRRVATQKMSMGYSTAHSLTAGAENLLVIWMGAKLVMANELSVGMLMAYISYKSTFAGRLYSLIDKWVDLKMLSLQGERLADILLTDAEDDDGDEDNALDSQLLSTDMTFTAVPKGAKNADFGGRIETRGISFRYADSEPWVLRNLDLCIKPGESVCIVGASGCGKSTLIKLLVGLMRPEEGEVLFDGVSVASMGLRNYRECIGVVMQDDQLLSGSIAQNICFFDQTPDMGWIEQCGRMAMIHDEIMAMPMGYMTLLGDMGSTLSGGQRQRVLLARALYKRPKVLFLDEATSHLDVHNETKICAAIQGLDMTRVIVAHRPETIASAQRIFSMQQTQESAR
jgi:ATP-binding cassette, subfamily B, bacterial CvaB/MchF/RaxB